MANNDYYTIKVSVRVITKTSSNNCLKYMTIHKVVCDKITEYKLWKWPKDEKPKEAGFCASLVGQDV